MDLRISKVRENGSIVLPNEILEKMDIASGDDVALIYESNRVIVRKLTSGAGRMTLDEFVVFRDVTLKNENHKKVAKAFYIFLSSVTGNP